ncbi:MAG: glycosyltransferase family 4 protein [Anaerolineales bacterium]|nr:glycosyltransferase family 4 protein [Anaerolineales bacterium]
MHIGIDARLPFYQMGGISQYVLHLLPALAALDQANRYTVFQMGRDGRSHTPAAPNFHARKLLTPCHHRLEKWALGVELLPHRLDVLHSPDFIPPAFGARRRIITVHDLNFLYFPQFLTPASLRYYRDQIDWACRQADHISADSHATRQDLIDRLGVPPRKVTTVHLAANPLYARPYPPEAIAATLAKHNLPRGFILFVGTLEPRKNLPTLIRAYARLRAETAVDVPLILVGGKGWIYEDVFETIEAAGVRPYVRHLSGIFDEELAHLYHAAGVLVTPSFYEGFGLPALEAMHCGCPAVVSRRGSLPEIVGPDGLMVDDPEDVEAWAALLARVLTDSALRARAVAAGHAQAQTFSWAAAAAKTLQLYELG